MQYYLVTPEWLAPAAESLLPVLVNSMNMSLLADHPDLDSQVFSCSAS